MILETFQKYQKSVLNLIDEITDLLNPQNFDPLKLYLLISVTAVLFKNYFAFLIPEFTKCAHPDIRDLAEKDIKELTQACDQYFQRWNDYSEIKNNPEEFCHETREYFAIPKARIAIEMQRLFSVQS